MCFKFKKTRVMKAKSYAKGKSLSDLVENYLKLLTKEEKKALKVELI